MGNIPQIIESERKRIYWKSHLSFVIVSLIPLGCIAILLYLYVFPFLIKKEEFLTLYISIIILALIFLLALMGYFFSLRGISRLEDVGKHPIKPFQFFLKVYVIVSLIPLVFISLLLLLYIIPDLIKQRNFDVLYSIIGVVCLAFILSLLGYFLTKRDIVGTIETIHRSKERLDSLVRLSTSISGVPHADLILKNIVEGAIGLLDVSGAYLYFYEKGDWILKAFSGVVLKELNDDDNDLLRNMWERVKEEKRIYCFDGDRFRDRYFNRTLGQVQIMVSPLYFQDNFYGVLMLANKSNKDGEFLKSDIDAVSYLTQQAAISIENSRFRDMQINYFTHTIELLVLSIEGHIVPLDHLHNVARYCSVISRRLKISDEERRKLYFGALLHDIGMIKIPIEQQGDPEQYKQHPNLGAETVSRIILWQDLVPIIKYHRENYDGSGYPEGLMGPEIPLAARIVAVAESFDAMTNPNSYRECLSFPEAFEELKKWSGQKYDPHIVDIFLEEIKEEDLL